jgi:hypothetical protein
MSKRIFINNLNTYVSQAIFSELRNDKGEDGEKNPDANTIFQIVGINKDGVELGPENFTAKPDQLTVGGNRSRQSFIRFNPEALWAVCAVSITKSEAKALNTTGAMGQLSLRVRACKRYPPAP